MKRSITFTDGYGLGLIASHTTGVNVREIVRHLSPEAKQIGMAIINSSSSGRARSATKSAAKSGKKGKSVSR